MSLKILLIVNLWIVLNLYLVINRIWVLIYIGPRLKTPQESYLDKYKSILTQSKINLFCLWISSKMKLIFLWSEKLKLTTVFQYLSLLWQVAQLLSGLIGQVMGGILLVFREGIHCKIIKIDCDADFEGIFMEINLRKKKWLLCYS